MALAQAFAADPVFTLRIICCESATHAWLNREEKLNPINSSSMFLCCFRVVRVRIATNTQAARSRHVLCARAHCSVSERHKQSTHSRRRAGATHLDGTHHTWKHPPEHLSHQPPFPSTKISLTPSQYLHHAPLIIQNFEELTMDTRCKASAPGTACGTP